MTELVVRRLLVDMESPIERDWCDGDAFRSAWFNALSMSFPVGEQFFIDAVRGGLQALPPERRAALEAEVRGFIGQEATHRRLHGLYNAHLDRLGLVNRWGPRAERRRQILADQDIRHWLAATAAYEHFTALLADWLLAHPQVLGRRDERLATLWLWHAAEESEHKCTAFDLYQALGGDHRWRLRWFRRVTLFFLLDAGRQTLANLRQDGSLWRWSTWRSAGRWLFGRDGLVRHGWRPWRAYLRRDFHPSQQDSRLAQEWLARHADHFVPVR